MADNVDITAGSGTTVAADDIGTVKFQRNKLVHGADGTNDGDVQRYNGFPISPALPKTKRCSTSSVAASSSGDNSLVTATAAQTTRVFAAMLTNNGSASVLVKWRSATTDLSGQVILYPGGSLFLPYCGEPYFVTNTNEALNLNLSAAVAIGGWVDYEKSA
jgi:hypothetical protein